MNEASPDSDENLMLRYAAGDAGAFDLLYARHRGGVFRYLLHHSGNRAAAEEMFQDVWLNLVKSRAGYTASARFASFLYRCAHNRLVDHYRAQGSAPALSLDGEDDEEDTLLDTLAANPADGPERMADRAQTRARLQAAIAALPPPQREAFLLQQESGLALAEIAALTGVGMETVKSRLRYALAKLRSELSEFAL